MDLQLKDNVNVNSCPTRRSSDLSSTLLRSMRSSPSASSRARRRATSTRIALGDRKSTRLNSSHRCISYAVFCLKKKSEDELEDQGREGMRAGQRRGVNVGMGQQA